MQQPKSTKVYHRCHGEALRWDKLGTAMLVLGTSPPAATMKAKESARRRMSVSYLVSNEEDEGEDQEKRQRLNSAPQGSPEVQQLDLTQLTGGSGSSRQEGGSSSRGVREEKVCSVCNEVCKLKAQVLFHEAKHGLRSDVIVCEKCGLGFTKDFTYRNHIKCVHEKEKRYQCEQCERSFFFKKDLPKHILAVHDKLKPFVCTTCNRLFAKREHLYRHERTVHNSSGGSSSASLSQKQAKRK